MNLDSRQCSFQNFNDFSKNYPSAHKTDGSTTAHQT